MIFIKEEQKMFGKKKKKESATESIGGLLLDIALDLFLNDGAGVREEARYLRTGISKEKLDEYQSRHGKKKDNIKLVWKNKRNNNSPIFKKILDYYLNDI